MKRHAALVPLSQEHLNALILVACLKNGEFSNPKYPWPQDPEAQREKIKYMWDQELCWHFKAEEDFFFQAFYTELSPPMQALTTELLTEHVELKQQIDALFQLSDTALTQALKDFGEQLEQHVRKEERQYFEGLAQEIEHTRLMKSHQALERLYQQRPAYFCIFTGKKLRV